MTNIDPALIAVAAVTIYLAIQAVYLTKLQQRLTDLARRTHHLEQRLAYIPPGLAGSHPSPEAMAEYCYSHLEREPGPGWKRCRECQHLYSSPEELEQATAKLGLTLPAENIFDCAHCGHDF